MADEASAQEKTEEATARRKTQARKKGTVARSADLTNAIVMVVLLALLPAIFAGIGNAFLQSMRASLSSLPTNVDSSTLARYAASALTPAVIAVIPLIGAALIVGLGANFAQVGFVLSPEVLNPNFDKINPLNGFKRLLSRN